MTQFKIGQNVKHGTIDKTGTILNIITESNDVVKYLVQWNSGAVLISTEVFIRPIL